MALAFEVVATDGLARRGRLTTPHGVIDTPAFMPVGTLGAVKGIEPGVLGDVGAQVLLANLYHLTLRPGIETIEGLGGLHAFCGWPRPMLTDSGGYQVFSLAARAAVDEAGVTFASHLDGRRQRFTPAGVVEAQGRLGVDLAMVLDECPPWPITEEEAAAALERTLRWARAARAEHERARERVGGLFGIAQGSAYRRLRERAVTELVALDFDGYAIGGVSVGEPSVERREVVEWTAPSLPAGKPRYLMGVGYPEDILHAVRQGVDLFDCVLPSRNARHGVLFTGRGLLRIKNARFRDDPRPIDEDCRCAACRRVSRAFVHHLIRAGEPTGGVLATLHNLTHFLDFMQRLRQAIELGTTSAPTLATRARLDRAGPPAER